MKNAVLLTAVSLTMISLLIGCAQTIETSTTSTFKHPLGGPNSERVIVTGSNAPTLAYANSWTTFSKQGEELQDAGMCTYVLFGRQVEKVSDDKTYQLYERLLNEIAATTSKFDASESEDLSQYNVFHVPTEPDASPDQPLIGHYNYPLAKRYLNKFACSINSQQAAAKLQSDAGPFLITTLKPLPSTSGNIYALYADLSDLHPTAISELLRAYKARVTTRRVTENEAFGPISVRVLSGILKAQDDLAIAKVSVLAWLNFGQKKKD